MTEPTADEEAQARRIFDGTFRPAEPDETPDETPEPDEPEGR